MCTIVHVSAFCTCAIVAVVITLKMEPQSRKPFEADQFCFPKCLILTAERKMSSAGLLIFPFEVNRNINSLCHFIDVETKALMTILMMMMNTFLHIG